MTATQAARLSSGGSGLQAAGLHRLPLALGRQAAAPLGRRSLRCRAEGLNAVEPAAAKKATKAGSAAAAAKGAAVAAMATATVLEDMRLAAELALEAYRYSPAEEPEALDVLASLKRKLESVARELGTVREEEFARLLGAGRERAAPALAPTPLDFDSLVREIREQHAATAHQQQQHTAPRQPAAAPAQAEVAERRNILPMKLKPLESSGIKAEGTGEEVLLQGFNWDSWKKKGGWYNHVRERAEELAQLGFTTIWMPPPTKSVSPEGYMPSSLYNLNSKYGTEEELIACVKELQSHGFKVLGDAVLNHRCAQRQDAHGVWNLYEEPTWDQRAIVGDDPNFRGRGNRSSGDFFTAAPNIDHSQEFVKLDLQEWLAHLRTHIGYDGWRLDYVRGFHGSHVKDYMEASAPQFAVGEYWDALSYEWDGTPSPCQDAHRQRTVNWINAAGGLATAFDITLKGVLHAVFERCEYWRLRDGAGKPAGLLGWWPSRSVTFLENHDTGSTQGHWRFPGHALEQGYCYILTHPGSPCVFWDHLHDNRLKDAIGRLIEARKRAGINCRSAVKILRADRDVYAAEIEGKEGNKLLMKIGPGDFNPRGDDWSIADCGQGWSVWEGKAAPAPAPAARPAAAPRKRAAASKSAAAASKPVEQSEQ